MGVKWTAQAVADLKAIHDLIARDAGAYAELLVEGLMEQVEALEAQPEKGSPFAGRADVYRLAQGPWQLLYHAAPEQTTVLALCPATPNAN